MPTSYLKNPSAFEAAISRGKLQHRSMSLRRVVWAISAYSKEKTPDKITFVETMWNDWQSSEPAEFRDRAGTPPAGQSGTLAADFERELDMEITILQAREAFPPPPVQAINRHRQFVRNAGGLDDADAGKVDRNVNLKRVAKGAMGAGGVGITVAQQALHTAGIVGVATGAAIVGTTGIGLLAGAIAGTIATSVVARVAVEKTFMHIVDLKNLQNNLETLAQDCAQLTLPVGTKEKNDYSRRSHDIVASHILPYIIAQKEAKQGHKEDASIPMLGALETVRAVGNNLNKRRTGEQGFKRNQAAHWLAAHFIECDCALAKNIVASLYSEKEMNWLLGNAEYQPLGDLLAAKMKAT